MKYSTVYVGMDVHKETFSLCCFTNEKEKAEYPQKVDGHYSKVINYIEAMRFHYGDDALFICGYEAGCLGFTLYHQLKDHNVKCVILAPTTMLQQKGRKSFLVSINCKLKRPKDVCNQYRQRYRCKRCILTFFIDQAHTISTLCGAEIALYLDSVCVVLGSSFPVFLLDAFVLDRSSEFRTADADTVIFAELDVISCPVYLIDKDTFRIAAVAVLVGIHCIDQHRAFIIGVE